MEMLSTSLKMKMVIIVKITCGWEITKLKQ